MTGLRLQILASLGLVTAAVSGLLGLALLGVAATAARTSLEAHIVTVQESAGASIGSLIQAGASGSQVDEMARHWIETGSIDGIWVFDGSGRQVGVLTSEGFGGVTVSPVIPVAVRSEVPGARGGAAQDARFLQVPAGRGMGCVIVGTDMDRVLSPMEPVRGFVIMYVGLHALTILALGYILLTFLIVRPVERLRGVALRIGEGRFDVEPDATTGAKEIRELGASLALAAGKLQAQRQALESKIRELETAQVEIRSQQTAIIRAEKLASVGRLAAGVAHEIGNPLSVILGFLDLLRNADLPDDDRRDYLARMHGEAERVNRIISDLLSYSRTGSGEPEVLDVASVLDGALSVLAPQKIMRGVMVEIAAGKGAPPVLASRDRLTQVFVNLILNAVEAMVGEGRLMVSVEADERAKHTVVRFQDDGPGMDAKILPFVFEPFVTTKPESQGTGLGLAVCHGIVQGLGGTIAARNRPGGGAEFEVRLPAAPEAADDLSCGDR